MKYRFNKIKWFSQTASDCWTRLNVTNEFSRIETLGKFVKGNLLLDEGVANQRGNERQ